MKVTYELVENTYFKIRKHIRNKHNISDFELLYYSNINELVNRINKGYIMGKYNIFFIKEKKYRLILSNSISDKIYNHLVSELILSKLDKYLIDSNVATRLNKGTSYARKLLDRYLIKLKSKKFYILKFDINKYFFNIDHFVLINKLSKYFNNNELDIIKSIINETNYNYINDGINKINLNNNLNLPLYEKNKGLSIGNMTSQMLAVFYLNDLDHYIKEILGYKYYIRYMDDGIILIDDKKRLRIVYDCLKDKIKEYKLEFNSKTKIYCSNEGFSFLGIRYICENNKVYRKINKNLKKKIIKKINNKNYKFYKHYFKYCKY